MTWTLSFDKYAPYGRPHGGTLCDGYTMKVKWDGAEYNAAAPPSAPDPQPQDLAGGIILFDLDLTGCPGCDFRHGATATGFAFPGTPNGIDYGFGFKDSALAVPPSRMIVTAEIGPLSAAMPSRFLGYGPSGDTPVRIDQPHPTGGVVRIRARIWGATGYYSTAASTAFVIT